MRRFSWSVLALVLAGGAAFCQSVVPVSADALRVDVSYLASDLLGGRGTPSAGQDAAAVFVASQFNRAGLEAAGDNGYFQTARFLEITPNVDGFELTLGGVKVPATHVRFSETVETEVHGAAVKFIHAIEFASLKKLTTAAGMVLVLEMPEMRGGYAAIAEARTELARLKPAAAIFLSGREGAQQRTGRVLRAAAQTDLPFPLLMVGDAAARKLLDGSDANLKADVKLAAPQVKEVTLRNVAGVLRGANPELRESYVLVTAHYDHLGTNPRLEGDQIFNGANDDASGTASLIEVAQAVAAAKPLRSVMFVAFFGEERGLLGSQYYVQHPLVPLAATIANVNLEQMGRTDDTDGARVSAANLTGFDYSDVAQVFVAAGKPLGVAFTKVEGKSDQFFRASDNGPFAEAGVPAHTISVAYIFPDYHQPGDEWNKLDYANMAKVDTAVAAGVLALANGAEAPRWNAANPRTEAFVKARAQ